MQVNRHNKEKSAISSMTKSGQSALEYMMTYGWAILIIVIVAVILYSMGIFNPASSISSTITGFSATPVSNAICTANGILRIAVGDTTGHRILIKNISATSNGKTEVFTPSSTVDPNPIITSGNTYIFSVPNACPAAGTHFSANVNINYTEPTPSFPTSQYISAGTLTGTVSSNAMPSFVPSFDGLNNQLLSATVNNLPIGSSPRTVIAWIFSPGKTNQYLLAYGNYNCNNLFGVQYGTGSTSNFAIVLFGDTCVSVPFPTSTWHFISNQYNGAATNGEFYVYYSLNGLNTLYKGSQSISNFNTSLTSFYFNCYANQPGLCLDGYLMDVQIYNSNLSSSQVQTIYSKGPSGVPSLTSNLIGWWPLNGTAKDYSGNGNNGVATNVVYTSNYPTTGLS